MSDSPSNRPFWGVIAAATLATLLFFLWPRVAEEFRPEPIRAHVAIETTDGIARTGRTEVALGTPARLHAVLEAKGKDGQAVYYTEADRLEVDGTAVPKERLRVWDRTESLMALWFTVEGKVPYVPIATPTSIDEWGFEEFFRADWPRTWSIAARVDSRHGVHLPRSEADRERAFGTQRYHVRLELRDPDRPAYVLDRYRSAGADQVLEAGDDFPTLQVLLPGVLERPSRVFGLSQLEPTEALPPESLQRLVALNSGNLAFSRATLFRDILTDREADLESLPWRIVTLGGDLEWSAQVAPGDLVRVGGRVTLLWQDRGTLGRFDREDLCFDFERGARIRPLGEVFSDGGRVEWAGQNQ